MYADSYYIWCGGFNRMIAVLLVVMAYVLGIGTHKIYKCDNQYRMLKRIDEFYKGLNK